MDTRARACTERNRLSDEHSFSWNMGIFDTTRCLVKTRPYDDYTNYFTNVGSVVAASSFHSADHQPLGYQE
jgi:hypothetical protein